MPIDVSLMRSSVEPKYYRSALDGDGGQANQLAAMVKMQQAAAQQNNLRRIAGIQDPAVRAQEYGALGTIGGAQLAESIGKQQYAMTKDERDEQFRQQSRQLEERHKGYSESLAASGEKRAVQKSMAEQREAILKKAQDTVSYLERHTDAESVAKGIDYMDTAARQITGYDPSIAEGYRQRLRADPNSSASIVEDYKRQLIGVGAASPKEAAPPQTIGETKGLEHGVSLESASAGLANTDPDAYDPAIINEMAANPNPGVLGRAWNAALGKTVSDEARKVARLQTKFAQIYGTHDTGATISPEQNFAYRQRFFRQPGDSDEDLAAKKVDRDEATLLILNSAQPQARKEMYRILGREDPLTKQTAPAVTAPPVVAPSLPAASSAAAQLPPVTWAAINALAAKRMVSPESIAEQIRAKHRRIEGE